MQHTMTAEEEARWVRRAQARRLGKCEGLSDTCPHGAIEVMDDHEYCRRCAATIRMSRLS